jgi:hypothetical protein
MKPILLCLSLVLILSPIVSAEDSDGAKRNYISFALGGYAPSGDLNDEGYKSGGDFTVSYMSPIKKYFGFGGGIHTYSTESNRTSTDIGDGEFAALGIEGLFYFQLNQSRIQPYLALGPAIYFNGLEYEEDADDDEVDESGSGFGFVTKAGVRAFFNKRFYGGVVLKAFSNQWNVEIEDGKDKTYQFGGGVMAFELGFTF